ncbi:ATP synthase subunit b [bacterium HR34]|nr:ATP synthase subunit b [bacterium HR34]
MEGGILEALGIDFKILMAQVVNFVILFLIFKKFLAKPLANVLQKRKETVEKIIKDSKTLEEKLAQIEKIRKQELEKAKQEYAKILEKAKISSQEMADKIIAQAKEQADRIIKEAKEQAIAQKVEMKNELKKELEEVFIKALSSILQKEYNQQERQRVLEELEKSLTIQK